MIGMYKKKPIEMLACILIKLYWILTCPKVPSGDNFLLIYLSPRIQVLRPTLDRSIKG